MANYSLILDAKFKPFSYQEMVTPVLEATKAHQALEDMYGELSSKANIWEEMANEQTDPYAYSLYKKYADDLTARADQLMQYGLNPASRRDMLDMKARYSKEILPIENAYNRREKLAAEQRQALLSNPTMFFQRDAATTSLDDFIRNPSLDYGASYSGALLTQQASQMAAALQNALTSRSGLKGIGLPFQYEELLQYGYTPADIQLAITDPKNPKAQPILNTIIDQVMTASGMNTWASDAQKEAARAYAAEGLYSAIGKPEIKNFTDNYSMELAIDAEKRRRDAEDAENAAKIDPDQLALNPTNIFEANEIESDAYSDFYDDDGQLNELGHTALEYGKFVYDHTRHGNIDDPSTWKYAVSHKGYSSDLSEVNDLKNAFLKDHDVSVPALLETREGRQKALKLFAKYQRYYFDNSTRKNTKYVLYKNGKVAEDPYGLYRHKHDEEEVNNIKTALSKPIWFNKDAQKYKNEGYELREVSTTDYDVPVKDHFGDWQRREFGNVGAKLGLNKKQYDATQKTEWKYQVANKDQADLRTQITSELQEDVPVTVMKGGKFVDSGETVSKEDLMNPDKYTIQSIRLSQYGNNVIYVDKSGNKVRVRLPIVNQANQASADACIKRADSLNVLYQEAKNSGNAKAAKEYREEYSKEIQSAITYLSSIGMVNTTKPQEFYPFANTEE